MFCTAKKKFLKTKLVNPFQLIKLSPKEKRGAAIVYINLRVTWIAFDGIEGINHGEFISPKLVLEAQGRKVADKE